MRSRQCRVAPQCFYRCLFEVSVGISGAGMRRRFHAGGNAIACSGTQSKNYKRTKRFSPQLHGSPPVMPYHIGTVPPTRTGSQRKDRALDNSAVLRRLPGPYRVRRYKLGSVCCQLLRATIHLDLARSGVGFLRHTHMENSMFVLCVHAVGVDRGRQSEGAGEASVITLDPLVAVRFGVVFDLSLAADRERVAFERQMNILLLDARHFHLKDDAVIFLIDVRSRSKRERG